MTPTAATLMLVDRADQGVCPAGHECFVTSTGGPSARFRRGCVAGEYEGMPLIRDDVTPAAIAKAEREGADPQIVEWAISTLVDRRETA